MNGDVFSNPLVTRYASREMAELFGDRRRARVWRSMWIWLAEAQRELGLPIADEQIAELKAHADDIDLAAAEKHERRLRHDVMAHVHAFGDLCPKAKPIIHLGATSCCVTDNGDLILLRDALRMIAARVAAVVDLLGRFAVKWRDLPCLAFTHMQPAQPTTVGKRATLWAHDFALDLAEIEHRLGSLKARGMKGTTGTQASYLELFHGDHDKVLRMERLVAQKMGFDDVYPVTGQTYSRKIDALLVDALASVAQSAHKMATDVRLLAARKELEEPFEADQIGSSAMAYKRNPMRSERICSLARFVLSLRDGLAQTAATQWMERTLDDSALRRLSLSQAFLATDAVLILAQNVATGMEVYPKTIAKNLGEELPFMATENILMAAVAAGGDRQDLHERIRVHSQAAARAVKAEGLSNDLLDRLKGDPAFAGVAIDARGFVGRAPEQVDEFVKSVVDPIRQRYAARTPPSADVKV